MPSSQDTKRAVKRRLADGRVKTYYYDRKPQPKEAFYDEGSIGALIAAYQISPEFTRLAKNSKENYLRALGHFQDSHHAPVKAIRRRDILATRDAIIATKGPAAATLFIRVASTLLSWAVDREWIEYSPATKLKNLPGGHLPAWTDEQAEIALKGLPEYLRRVVILGMYTGQRRGDLAAMPWSTYQDGVLRIRPQKTSKPGDPPLVIPVHVELRRELEIWTKNRKAVTILTTKLGRPWIPLYLSREMATELQKLGLPKGLNVHGLRKLASARLAQAGCSTHEIAAITGHKSLSMVQLYTKSADQERLAKAAVLRLENNFTKRAKKTSK
ncbi:tyrosine-type recombinase/integrase [Acidisoma cellulosilytica]|uniref:Tyrosine-type recombinase/integrase n=1 Tax=Acidisoma cellulosilyticum TaxID=2802395 RepID=A0A964E370_9PROT|nr:tyrosine-type recombinase/integrase [Acidisoma cellulosilyticum]MCB8880064.1 tyrosine-type recombinase/integrase [Acidisoma cellulosilyticum]